MAFRVSVQTAAMNFKKKSIRRTLHMCLMKLLHCIIWSLLAVSRVSLAWFLRYVGCLKVVFISVDEA